MAGVVGMDRWLLRAVSIDSGWVLGTPEFIPWFHVYELSWLVTPIRLDALAGGVGNPGRWPMGGCGICEDMGVCIAWCGNAEG